MVYRTIEHKTDVHLVYQHWRNYVLFTAKHKGNSIRVQAVKVCGEVEF